MQHDGQLGHFNRKPKIKLILLGDCIDSMHCVQLNPNQDLEKCFATLGPVVGPHSDYWPCRVSVFGRKGPQ